MKKRKTGHSVPGSLISCSSPSLSLTPWLEPHRCLLFSGMWMHERVQVGLELSNVKLVGHVQVYIDSCCAKQQQNDPSCRARLQY